MTRQDILNALRSVEMDTPTIIDAPLTISQHLSSPLVRPQHVADAWTRPDGVAVLTHETSELAVLTKAITTAQPFVLVVLATRLTDEWIAGEALRLYTDQPDALAAQPLETLADLLDRYGLDFDLNGTPTRFAPFIRLPRPATSTFEAVAETLLSLLDAPPAKAHFPTTFRLEGDELQVAWPYFLDVAKYEADVKRAQR